MVGAVGVIGEDMVRSANQSYIVRSAHGLLAALVLKMILDRRWLFSGGLNLYSRPRAGRGEAQSSIRKIYISSILEKQ